MWHGVFESVVHGIDDEKWGGAYEEPQKDQQHHPRQSERLSARPLPAVLAPPGRPLPGSADNAAQAGVADADEEAGHDVAGCDGCNFMGLTAVSAEGTLEDALLEVKASPDPYQRSDAEEKRQRPA